MSTGRKSLLLGTVLLGHLLIGIAIIWIFKRSATGNYIIHLFISRYWLWQSALSVLIGLSLAYFFTIVIERRNVKIPAKMQTIFRDLGPNASYGLQVLAGFYEEFLFRGVLQGLMAPEFGKIPSLLIAWFAFTALHVPQYWRAKEFIVGVAALSAACGIWFAVTGNLIGPIVIHMVFNVYVTRKKSGSLFSSEIMG